MPGCSISDLQTEPGGVLPVRPRQGRRVHLSPPHEMRAASYGVQNSPQTYKLVNASLLTLVCSHRALQESSIAAARLGLQTQLLAEHECLPAVITTRGSPFFVCLPHTHTLFRLSSVHLSFVRMQSSDESIHPSPPPSSLAAASASPTFLFSRAAIGSPAMSLSGAETTAQRFRLGACV